jgi:hypothetical protein
LIPQIHAAGAAPLAAAPLAAAPMKSQLELLAN